MCPVSHQMRALSQVSQLGLGPNLGPSVSHQMWALSQKGQLGLAPWRHWEISEFSRPKCALVRRSLVRRSKGGTGPSFHEIFNFHHVTTFNAMGVFRQRTNCDDNNDSVKRGLSRENINGAVFNIKTLTLGALHLVCKLFDHESTRN